MTPSLNVANYIDTDRLFKFQVNRLSTFIVHLFTIHRHDASISITVNNIIVIINLLFA